MLPGPPGPPCMPAKCSKGSPPKNMVVGVGYRGLVQKRKMDETAGQRQPTANEKCALSVVRCHVSNGDENKAKTCKTHGMRLMRLHKLLDLLQNIDLARSSL